MKNYPKKKTVHERRCVCFRSLSSSSVGLGRGEKKQQKKRGVSNFRGKKKGGKTPWLITCSRKQEKEKSLRTFAKVVRKNMIDRGVTENMAVNMIE